MHKLADGKCIEGVGVGCKLEGLSFIVIAENAAEIVKIGALLEKTVKDTDMSRVAVFMARDTK
jgi:hypothetical protein